MRKVRGTDFLALATEISAGHAAIYRHCHPVYTVALGHQAVRALQLVGEAGATIQSVARELGCATNTASEIVRRLAEKNLVTKTRRPGDERVVDVRITPDGGRVLLEQTGLDAAVLSRALAGLDDERRAKIAEGIVLLLSCVRSDP